MKRDPVPAHLGIRRHVVQGALSLTILLVGFGGWAAFAELSAATMARGQLGQNSHNRAVQHPTGGQIQTLNVAEGDHVQQGATLLRLDDSRNQGELSILNTRIFEIAARRARLIAERDNLPEVDFSTTLRQAAQSDDAMSTTLDGQARLHAARLRSWQQERQSLNQSIQQLQLLAQGTSAQIDAFAEQSSLLSSELTTAENLNAKGLVPAARILTLKREIAILMGKTGAARSKHAETLARVSEIELEILRLTSQRREMAIEQLRDLDFRRHELLDQRRAVQARIDALTITAPVGGVVLGLGTLAENMVVEPAQTLMRIVPQDRVFAIQTQISPARIAHIYPGQAVRFAFPGRAKNPLEQLDGTVDHVAADTQTDATNGQPYFQVKIIPTPTSSKQIANATDIVPGMPVELYFDTGSQPAWQYLMKPFLAYFSKAMRES